MNSTDTSLDRNIVIKAIKANLQRRSGKQWSVTGGRGTAWGWIKIDAPPARCTWSFKLPEGVADSPQNYIEVNDGCEFGHMSPDDRKQLGELLGLENVHYQGISIPSSHGHYREYLERSEGKTPTALGECYWD